jgi:hypothetical protein
MPQPQNVNPEKFKVSLVLYNHNDFSITLGTWTPDNTLQIAMRWNDADDGNGYPKVFAHPQWFLVSNNVAKNLLHGLLGNQHLTHIENENILKALSKI